MAKHNRKNNVQAAHAQFDNDIRFIVPMPGKSSWNTPDYSGSFKKIHQTNDFGSDLALEDYQAQFLLQREYLID